MEVEGATVVVSHHVLDDKRQEYEDWLNEIGPICRSSHGNIDWQIIRPIVTLTDSYTVIVRFDTVDNLENWMKSHDRKRLIAKIRPLLLKDDNYYIKSGLDFLFTPENEKMESPVRWKQYLVTLSAIYPLSLIIPLILLPALRMMNIPPIRLIDSFFVSGIIVLLMVYLVMPNYTRWIKKWLYK
jgi:uncharacterized protein